MWSRKTVAAIAVVGLTLAALGVDAAEAQPEPSGFAELAVGEWLGNGRAGGVSNTNDRGMAISVSGDFFTQMEFVVDIDGSLAGSWVLDGASNGDFYLFQSELAFVDEMTHSASGPMAGNSRQFSLGTAMIDTTHNVVGDAIYSGTSTDPIGPIDLKVAGIYCNDAWGEWIMSWNIELESQKYTPTFDGDWYAVRQSAEFSEQEGNLLEQISALYSELVNEFADIQASQPFSPETGWVLPADALWGYLYRLVDLHNALRNLTLCDRALIGDAAIEAFLYNVTGAFTSLMLSLLAQYELGAADLNELVNLAAAAGAIGEGSVSPDADTLESALDGALGEVVNDSSASASDRVSAEATRWQNGWVLD